MATNKAEGFFKNGDQWTGLDLIEGGRRYFVAIDSNGNEYETVEMPTRYPFLTMIRVPDGVSEKTAMQMIAAAKAV